MQNATLTCNSTKPKYGTWFFNPPQKSLTYKEILKKNSYKRIKNNSKLIEKGSTISANKSGASVTANEKKLAKELKEADPVKFFPLHREPDQKNPYFTVNEGYGI